MMRSPADRRDRVRFEVFGPFWGTFDVGEPVRVLDLSASGALIEAQQPLAVESVQSVKLMIDGQPTVTEAKVKHVRSAPLGAVQRYLVGVEFLAAPSAFLDAVERLVAFRAVPTELT
jgi:PilZ domain-containing protein